jgi:hypothetical protein
MVLDSIGTRVMDSTPHAIAMSYAPAMTPCAAKCAACCDEPHCRSRVVAGTDSGRPAPSVATDVERLLADLVHAAGDHVVDELRVDAGALRQPGQDQTQEVGRVHTLQAALTPSNGGADGVDDNCFTHGDLPGDDGASSLRRCGSGAPHGVDRRR